jgi:hypothetical protein
MTEQYRSPAVARALYLAAPPLRPVALRPSSADEIMAPSIQWSRPIPTDGCSVVARMPRYTSAQPATQRAARDEAHRTERQTLARASIT